jgi:hypothetical protein
MVKLKLPRRDVAILTDLLGKLVAAYQAEGEQAIQKTFALVADWQPSDLIDLSAKLQTDKHRLHFLAAHRLDLILKEINLQSETKP